MDYSDIENGLSEFVERYDSQTFIGSYRETQRTSLLNAGLGTRANSLWKMAEYVVAKYDDKKEPIVSYISGWKKLASKINNQYLLLEEDKDVWGMYDAKGNRLGDDRFILDYFSKMKKKKLSGKYPLQKIFYGTPGSGKSHKLKELVEKEYPIEDDRDKYIFRTTFHPDSDYASFVGCYKPRMVGKDIEYKFTPQNIERKL